MCSAEFHHCTLGTGKRSPAGQGLSAQSSARQPLADVRAEILAVWSVVPRLCTQMHWGSHTTRTCVGAGLLRTRCCQHGGSLLLARAPCATRSMQQTGPGKAAASREASVQTTQVRKHVPTLPAANAWRMRTLSHCAASAMLICLANN